MRRDRRAEESGERREREGEESRGEMLPCRFGVLGGECTGWTTVILRTAVVPSACGRGGANGPFHDLGEARATTNPR